MKKFLLIYFFLAFLIFISSVNAQTTSTSKLTKPFVEIDANFGYAMPSFDLKGDAVREFYDLTSYGTTWGFNPEIKVKFTLANFSSGQFKTFFTLGYAQFGGKSDIAHRLGSLYANGYLPINWPEASVYRKSDFQEFPGESSITINNPMTALGFEVGFFLDPLRRHIINISTDFNVNVIFGKIYDAPTGGTETYNSINANTRLGLGFNLGYSYRFSKVVGINVGTRVQFSNLFGKKYEPSTSEGELMLNDKSEGQNPFLTGDRSIGFFGFYGGVAFYLGGKK